jgi:adenosylcobinamide amidohydrolase
MRAVAHMSVRPEHEAAQSVHGRKAAAPWRWQINGATLIVFLPSAYRVLSWAPLGGGLRCAGVILNHQIEDGNRAATDAASAYLSRLVRAMGCEPRSAVAMMTGASVVRAAYASARRNGYVAGAWCTAGTRNALRVGDPASVESTGAGTINLIVAVNRPLSAAAMVEAVQIAVEARVLAVQQALLKSVRSGRPATGTGTDCVAIASPMPVAARRDSATDRGRVHAEPYCGKHTRLGELIGRAVLKSSVAALARRIN